MRPSNRLFKTVCVTVVLATVLSISPQNIAQKHINLGNVTNNVIRTTERIWHSVSTDIYLDILKPIKHFLLTNSNAPATQDSQTTTAVVGPDKETDIKSPSGKVTLKIPAGAVKNQTNIDFVEDNPQGAKSISLSPGSGKMLSLFELSAKESVSLTAVSTFQKNLEIDIQNTPEDLAGIDTSSLKLYYYNEKTQVWEVVPSSTFDPKTNELTATTDHFSIYGEQGNPNIEGPGRIMATQVDLQSGTGTFSYPLDLPVAQGGFQPKLELSYNSGSADEMKDLKAGGSWVGIGWSFSLGQISYDATAGKYYLDLNGVSYELMSTDGTNYHTNPESYYKVTRDTGNNKWTMLDRDGYTYEFGGTTDSQQYINNAGTKQYYQWDLDMMKDTNGNPAIVHYVQDIRGANPNDWVRSAYADYLRYGFTNPADINTYKFEVKFDTAAETDYGGTDGQLRPDNPRSYTYSYSCNPHQCPPTWTCDTCYNAVCTPPSDYCILSGCGAPGCTLSFEPYDCNCRWVPSQNTCWDTCYATDPAPMVMENRRLSSVEIKVGGTSSTLLRRYDLSYTTTPCYLSGTTYYAGTMTLNSITQIGADGTSALPAMSFTYSNLTTNYNGSPSFSWPHLTQVNSGYGGTIAFSYTQIPSTAAAIWSREVVTTKTINSGIGSTVETHNYTYLGNVATSDPNPQYFGTGTMEQFRGFEKVQDTYAASNYTQHYFYTTGTINGNDAEKLTGREYKTDYYDSNSHLLQEKFNYWSWVTVITNNYFIKLDKEEATTYKVGDINTKKTTRTEYSYDSYGNVTTEKDWGDTGITTDNSIITRTYYPNTATNIVDKVATEKVYLAADDSFTVNESNLKQQTNYYYDGNNTALTTPPTKGMVTRVESKKDASNSVSTYSTYDSYGNVLTSVDANNNTTTTGYDTTYHIYPISKTYPITGLSESCTFDAGAGNVLTHTDVNSQVTVYEYDTFKRLTKTIKPGDSSGSPSITYQYNSWGTINSQNLKTITKVDSSTSIWSADYFDGLGRVVQTQAQSETSGHTMITGTTTFNTCGQVDKQYVSQDIASALTAYYNTGIGNWKYSTSTYDALGRVVTQTAVDGTTVSNDYTNVWQTVVTNERGFQTTYLYDAFNRLTQVQNSGAPTVITNAATSITSSAATLNGNLAGLGGAGSVTVNFEWGLTTSYGNTTTGQPMSATGNFNAAISGLSAGTTYHFRAKAVGMSTGYGNDFTLTTPTVAPAVSSSAAGGINPTTAMLNGALTTLGSATSVTVSFQWGLTTSYGSTTTGQALPSPANFYAAISGLTASTTYHFRAKAVGSSTVYGSDQQFTTQASGGSPVEINKSVATGADDGFSGSGDFDNTDDWYEIGHPDSSTTYNTWFRFTGITIPAGATIEDAYLTLVQGQFDSGTVLKISADDSASPTAPTSQSNHTSKVRTTANAAWTSGYSDYAWHNSPSFTAVIQELVNSYTYSSGAIQILVDNNGSTSGKEAEGSTYEDSGYAPKLYIRYHTGGGGSSPPAVGTDATSSITSTTATLNGTLTSLGSASSVQVSFEWGTDTNYGNATTPQAKTATGAFTTGLTGLNPNTVYHVRAKAVGATTTYGSDMVFQTSQSVNSVVTTTYTYDTLGNLTQVVDANNNTTTMSYDWLARKTAMTDPDMGTWSYGYDSNGNLTTQTDAKSQTITMVYDAMNRLTNKNYPTGSGMTNVVYTYDSTAGGNYGKGLRTGMTDAAGTTSDTYDTRGRLIQEKKTISSVDYTTSYTYDGLDRAVTVTYPTGETVTNGYNGRGLPTTVSGSVAGSLVTNTLYNQLGAITQINLGNNLKTNYTYWGLDYGTTAYGKLWEIKTQPQSGGTALQDMQYTWDDAGNLTQRQNLVSSETENFTYDSLDRLTAVSGAYTQSYTYNTIGNITAMNGTSYTYGDSSHKHAVTSVGTTNYAYDANGNMTTRGTQSITWDVENRVISVTGGASFVYDGDGNRVKKTEGGQTILYINQYYEKNLTTGVVTTYYYLGGQLVAQSTGGTLKYIHQDSLGSTSAMSTSTGTLDSSISYFPFGATRTGSVNTPKEFTGQRLDSTGLYYYNARYYDPAIGRFISPDTEIQNFTNPQNLNRYSYCLNNPLKYVDPSGYEHVYVTDEGLNDDGEYWYCVYSDKAHNNLIAIVTGADNLASRYSDFDIENDRQSMTSQLNTTAYQNASAYSYVSGESVESVFFGGSDFGITVNVDNVDVNNNRNTILTYIAMGFVFGAEFNESGIPMPLNLIDSLLSIATPDGEVGNGIKQYQIHGNIDQIIKGLTVDSTPRPGSPGFFDLEDGTIVGSHPSKTNDLPTIDINRNGIIYKIRVLP